MLSIVRKRIPRAGLIAIVVACAPLGALACSAFGEDATPESAGEGGVGTDGTTSQVGDGGGSDGGVPLRDADFLDDGAIQPFGSKCETGDPREDEDLSDGGNGTDLEANVLPNPSGVVCGMIQPGNDTDVFRYEATTAAVVRVGFHISGNGKIGYVAPGKSGGPGAQSPSSYRAFDINISGPGTIYFTVSAGTVQEYRLAVTQ